MDICLEHRREIAYAGGYCPACEEIEELNDEHKQALDDQRDDFEYEIRELNDRIEELESEKE